eukprot:CAMPEP_0194486992 /NCGR_PEP_ID=MMETSP0253-20130528/7437_1 /TAXON_ID=2966 /ORGANISM="Noctiluca scintillans" /LENGTH=126 /DNA_ID=CAMNT_0039327147 /DNA_START=40 /DNA_END=420 /DNA_ORIENTATION=+
MVSVQSLLIFVTVTAALAEVVPQFPPEPMGALPEKAGDLAWATHADACQACRYTATGSCAMYHTCVCHATNAHFGGESFEVTDQEHWRWSCSADGGSKYQLCFQVDQQYEDAFGDKFDPNAPKCPQ